MIALVLAIIFGLGFTYFSLQNTQLVTLRIQDYIVNIPLYYVAIASMLLGITIAFIINLPDSISSALAIFSKDRKIRSVEGALTNLENRIAELQAENERLRNSKHEPILHQSPLAKPNFFQKVRHNLSV